MQRRCVKVRYISIDQMTAVGIMGVILATGFEHVFRLETVLLKSLYLYIFPIHKTPAVCVPHQFDVAPMQLVNLLSRLVLLLRQVAKLC